MRDDNRDMRSSPSTINVGATANGRVAQAGAHLTRDRLMEIAVARGCSHYRLFVAPGPASDDPTISHEFLGCALLQGVEDVETFQSIRVGAMVLSDLGNDPQLIRTLAEDLGVSVRLTQLATVALGAGDEPLFWRSMLDAAEPGPVDDDFFPTASRLSLESFSGGTGSTLRRQWLRTAYRR